MATWTPDRGFLQALTTIDTGEAELIVTAGAPEAAAWAKRNGYRVTESKHGGDTVWEIRPGDRGIDGPLPA